MFLKRLLLLALILFFTNEVTATVPQATLCRKCDSEDPAASGDDCGDHPQHVNVICDEGCLTRYTAKVDGSLRIQKSCGDELTCRNEWWKDTRKNPECTEAKLSAGTLTSGTRCSFCCRSDSHLSAYCNSGVTMVPDSLVTYTETTATNTDTSPTTSSSPSSSSTSSSSSSTTTPQGLPGQPTTGVNLAPMKCMNCRVTGPVVVCQATPIYCQGDRPLCMTSFFDDGRGNLTLVKRCASIADCSTLWWRDTQSRSDCMGDEYHDPYSWPSDKMGECHYCCQTTADDVWAQPCNRLDFPTKPNTTINMPLFIDTHFPSTVAPTTTQTSAMPAVKVTRPPTAADSGTSTVTTDATSKTSGTTKAPSTPSTTQQATSTAAYTTETPTASQTSGTTTPAAASITAKNNSTTPQQGHRKCVQCGNENEPCGAVDLLIGEATPCPFGLDYCLTSISHSLADHSRSVTKKCVNRDECNRKWFIQSSDNDKCVDFDPNDPIYTDLSCFFCCTVDGCNVPYKPDDSTLFTG